MGKDSKRLEQVRELQLVSSHAALPNYFHGESMRPFLQEGDLVTVEPVTADQLRLGDVATFRDKDLYTTRRVVYIDTHLKRIGGKADNWPDHKYYYAFEDVLGRVTAYERDGETYTRADLSWRARAVWITVYLRLRSMALKVLKK